jgi:hypothetical protein
MRMKNLLIFFEIFAAWMRIPDNQDLINILWPTDLSNIVEIGKGKVKF